MITDSDPDPQFQGLGVCGPFIFSEMRNSTSTPQEWLLADWGVSTTQTIPQSAPSEADGGILEAIEDAIEHPLKHKP